MKRAYVLLLLCLLAGVRALDIRYYYNFDNSITGAGPFTGSCPNSPPLPTEEVGGVVVPNPFNALSGNAAFSNVTGAQGYTLGNVDPLHYAKDGDFVIAFSMSVLDIVSIPGIVFGYIGPGPSFDIEWGATMNSGLLTCSIKYGSSSATVSFTLSGIGTIATDTYHVIIRSEISSGLTVDVISTNNGIITGQDTKTSVGGFDMPVYLPSAPGVGFYASGHPLAMKRGGAAVDNLFFFSGKANATDIFSSYLNGSFSRAVQYGPSVSLDTSYDVFAGRTIPLASTVVQQNDVLSTWATDGLCLYRTIDDSSALATTAVFNQVAEYNVSHLVVDRVNGLCAYATTKYVVDGDLPELSKYSGVSGDTLFVPPGGRLDVNTTSEASPKPLIFWTRVDSNVSGRAGEMRIEPYSNKLVIDGVKAEDDGAEFYATASNVKGTAVGRRFILRVGEAPNDDDSIVGTAVGSSLSVLFLLGLLLCCCLCCICCIVFVAIVVVVVISILLVLAVVGAGSASLGGTIKIVKSRTYKKKIVLVKPNFSQFYFGTFDDEGKVKPRHELSSEALEKVFATLGNPEGHLFMVCKNVFGSSDQDDGSRAAAFIAELTNNSMPFMRMIIHYEVAQSESRATLFRENSVASKVFGVLARMYALEWAWNMLARPIAEIADTLEDEDDVGDVGLVNLGNMELDPRKLTEVHYDFDVEENALTLWYTVQKFFSIIRRSHKTIPSVMRDVLVMVDEEVDMKYPGEGKAAIGSFLFLRFLCPAIMSPQVYGLLDHNPCPQLQRELILITKLLQNLVNNTLPGIKEAHMERLNEFVTSNQGDLYKFYDQLLQSNSPTIAVAIPGTVRTNALNWFGNFIVSNQSKVEDALRKEGYSDVADHIKSLS